MIALREYQREAVAAIWRELGAHRSTLLVMATGTGKTFTFATFAGQWIAAGRGRVLVLAHREELIEQARRDLERIAGLRVGIEKAERHAAGALEHLDAVVGSIQTLASEGRRAAFAPDAFTLVIVDEAHHATADSYQAVLARFSAAKVLGVTATPDRSDGLGMGRVFETVALEYGVRDAIGDEHLVPVRQVKVEVEGLDLASVRTVAGDLHEGELEEIMLDAKVLEGVARPVVELAGTRQTAVFATSVQHAHKLAEVIRDHGRTAIAVDGGMGAEERAAALGAFRRGAVQFITNCAILTEGYDDPSIACVAMARPTKSRSLYAQAAGRALRLCPMCQKPCEHKPDALLVDLVGNAGKHALVSAVDILADREDAAVVARAKMLAADGEQTVIDAIDQAREQIAAEMRRKAAAQARYRAKEVSPFEVLGATVKPTWWAGLEASEKQRAHLEKNGISAEGLTRGQASALLDKVFDRARRGLCTFKMAQLLQRNGFDPDVDFATARKHIDWLKANRWRKPAA